MRRPRPVAGVDLRVVTAPLGGSSFPSGHTITYVGVYGFLAFLAHTLIRPVAARRVVVGGSARPRGARRTESRPPGSSLVHRRRRVVPARARLPHRADRACIDGSRPIGAGCRDDGGRTGHGCCRQPEPPLPDRAQPGGRQQGWDHDQRLHARGAVRPRGPIRPRRRHRGVRRRGGGAGVGPGRGVDGIDVVVAAGGDGTADLVAEQLLETDTALAILPLGSVMNLARALGIPRDLEAAAEIIRDGKIRRIDVGEARHGRRAHGPLLRGRLGGHERGPVPRGRPVRWR